MTFHRAPLPRLTIAALSLVASGFCLDAQADVVYSTYTPYASPTNFVSWGYEATSTSEFGDHIALGAGGRNLTSVTVTMSDWAVASTFGSTAAGYFQNLTLNLYDYTGNTVGNAFATATVDAFVPWRPETTSNCNNDGYGASCYHGIAFDVTFDFSGVTVPNDFVYGLAFDTGDYGAAPTGVNGPYNSLNVAFADNPTPSVGTDVNPDALFINSSWSGALTTGSTGSFNEDTGWSGYVPMVQFVTSATATVPEPSSIALFGIALAGLAGVSRRKRR